MSKTNKTQLTNIGKGQNPYVALVLHNNLPHKLIL